MKQYHLIPLLIAALLPAPLAAQDAPVASADPTAILAAEQQKTLDRKLILAVIHRDTTQLEQLLAQGANPNGIIIENGTTTPFTAIHVAVSRGFTPELRLLLAHGADPKQLLPGLHEASPLASAILSRHYLCAKLLLEAPAEGWSARELSFSLKSAITMHCEPLADLLLKHGADINGLQFDNTTCLSSCIWAPYSMACLNYILRNGYRLDAPHHSLVAEAMGIVNLDREGCLDRILQAGYPINARDPEGHSLLSAAVQKGNRDKVIYLMQQGADPRLVDAYGRHLHELAPAGSDIPALLLAQAERLNAEGRPLLPPAKLELSPLLRAIVAGDEAAVRRLLDEGAKDVQAQTEDTPLMLAVKLNKPGMVRLLLERGADPLQKNHTRSFPLAEALMLESYRGLGECCNIIWPQNFTALTEQQQADIAIACAYFGSTARLQQLLNTGLLDKQPALGDFLLIEATIACRVDIAKLLIEAGVDPRQKSSYSYSPWDYSRSRPEMRQLFEDMSEE